VETLFLFFDCAQQNEFCSEASGNEEKIKMPSFVGDYAAKDGTHQKDRAQ